MCLITSIKFDDDDDDDDNVISSLALFTMEVYYTQDSIHNY
jgi:hypothetical protein